MRYEESLALVLRAQALDPLSLPVHQTVARCYSWAGEYEKALSQLRTTQQMEPHHPLTYAWFGRVFLGMGRLEDALTQVQKGMEVAGRLPLLLQLAGCALGRLGKHREAGEILVELQQLSTRQYVSPTYQAYVLGAMGELGEALRMFERAVEQRSGLLALAHVTHETAVPALWSNPRFAALLKKAGLD
jgi:tetratricopeptide (TPR) repeat protein